MTSPGSEQKRASPPERYEAMAAHKLRQAQAELDRGDLQQASEKVWGAAAQSIKALAQQQGWNHHAHNYLRDAARYAAYAWGREELLDLYDLVSSMHTNFYEHQEGPDIVQRRINNARTFTAIMAELRRAELPQDQSHLTPDQREGQERRWRALTRKTTYSLGPEFAPEELADLPPVEPGGNG